MPRRRAFGIAATALTAVVLVTATFALGAGPASAAVQTKTVTWQHEGVTLEGYLAWDDALAGPRPGVLVVH